MKILKVLITIMIKLKPYLDRTLIQNSIKKTAIPFLLVFKMDFLQTIINSTLIENIYGLFVVKHTLQEKHD